jgi:hypothetical protein
MPDAISGVDSKIMDAMQKGKPFDCDRLPRNLIGKVEMVEEKPKKVVKKEID